VYVNVLKAGLTSLSVHENVAICVPTLTSTLTGSVLGTFVHVGFSLTSTIFNSKMVCDFSFEPVSSAYKENE